MLLVPHPNLPMVMRDEHMNPDPQIAAPADNFRAELARTSTWMRFGYFLPWFVLIFCLGVSYLLWRVEVQAVNQYTRDYFDFRVRDLINDTRNRLRVYEQTLQGAQALFNAAGNVNRDRFRKYVSTLGLDTNYPGIQGIGFSQIVLPGEMQRHIATIRSQGFPEYVLKPEGKRTFYTAIIYLEPFVSRNLRAFGYDMYSEAVRRKAMERARDTDRAAMTGKVVLVQETGKDVQSGFLMYLPVYRKGMPHATLAERRANIIGWVYSVFRMGDLMRGIYGERADEFDIHVYDGNVMSGNTLMYASSPANNNHSDLIVTRHLDIAGHEWTIRVASLPALESRTQIRQPGWVAGGGILASLLLSMITWLLMNGRRHSIRLALDLNQELIASRQAVQKESEKNLALLHNASDGIHILDLDGNVIEASNSFCTMLGYRRDELIGMNVSVWEARLSKTEIVQAIREQFARKERSQRETQHRRKDGSVFDVEVSSLPLELDGKPVLFKSSRDITERKQAEIVQQENEQRFRYMLETCPTAARIAMKSGSEVVYFNPRYTALINAAADQVAGTNPANYYADQKDYADILQHLENGEQIFERLVELNIPGAGTKWALASYLNIRYQDEPAVLGWFHDITETIRVERMKSEFVSTVSHELRTPLTAISGALGLIASGKLGDMPVSVVQMIDIAHRNSQRLTYLINDLLDMEKLVAGKMQFDMQKHLLTPLIEEVIEANASYGADRRIRLILVNVFPGIEVYVDRQRLLQVLSNLLSNAIKYSPDDGMVEVALQVQDGSVRITVTDHGPGIPAEFHRRIFQKFSQADSTDTRQKGGTGLGLAISREFVERMGGEIGFDSVEGQGASFYLDFPIAGH